MVLPRLVPPRAKLPSTVPSLSLGGLGFLAMPSSPPARFPFYAVSLNFRWIVLAGQEQSYIASNREVTNLKVCLEETKSRKQSYIDAMIRRREKHERLSSG